MNPLLTIVVVLAVAATQFLAGGRTIALCLPAYALLAVGAILGWWPRRRMAIPRAHTEGLATAVLLAGYICLRALWSPEEYLARNDFFVALGALALYLIVALNLTSSRWRVAIATGLMILAVINCAVGAGQFLAQKTQMPFHLLPLPLNGTRISGFYGYPNHLAAFLEMSLMMALSIAFWSRWPVWAKLFSGYVALMCLAGIIATGSRGGYIACTVGLLVFALLSLVLVGKLAPSRVIGFFLAGVLLIGGGAGAFKIITSKNLELSARASSTLTVDPTRMRLWQAAWKQFRLHPAFGTGSGSYLVYGRQFRSPGVQTDPTHAHNDYFELLAEYGIVGIIAAVIFLETHVRTGWNSFRRRLSADTTGLASNSLALNVGALSATAACLVYCLLDFTLHMAANVFVMAFIFALLGTPGTAPETAPAEEAEGDLPAFLRLAAPVLAICLALRVFPTAGAEFNAERCRVLMSGGQFAVSPEAARQLESLARRGLTFDARNPSLYYALGVSLTNQADFVADRAAKNHFEDQAIDAFGRAMELVPRDVNYVLLKAGELDEVKRFDEADPLFARALELDPKSGRVVLAVAAHLEAEGKLPEAVEKYREAMRLGEGTMGQFELDRIEKARKADGATAAPSPDRPGLH